MTDVDERANIELTVAKPSTQTHLRWGPVREAPQASGLYVPYVKELSKKDTITLPKLITDYFVKSLGSNVQDMVAELQQVTSAWGVISTTDLGHEISHLAKCIDICLKAQAIVYPCYSGTIYEGCVISGALFTIGYKSDIIEPIAYEELQVMVENCSLHQKALSEIYTITGMTEEAIIKISTMRELSKAVKAINMNVNNQQRVMKAALQLNYANKYMSTSTNNVKVALSLLINPEDDIPDEYPMHPNYLFTTDRVESVMTGFGYSAFTFMLPNGKKCHFGDNLEAPEHFAIHSVPVSKAVLDMEYMLENGYITNNTTGLSSKHKAAPLKGSVKVDIWKMLQTLFSHQFSDVPLAITPTRVPSAGGRASANMW
jgi:hypothetical protein